MRFPTRQRRTWAAPSAPQQPDATFRGQLTPRQLAYVYALRRQRYIRAFLIGCILAACEALAMCAHSYTAVKPTTGETTMHRTNVAIAAFLLCILCCATAFAGTPGFDTVRVDLPDTTQFLYGCTTYFDPMANALSANCNGNHAQVEAQPAPNGPLIVASMLSPGYTHWSYDGPCVLLQPHTTAPDGHDSWWLNCGDVIFRDGFEARDNG